jgi:hypothetical protein
LATEYVPFKCKGNNGSVHTGPVKSANIHTLRNGHIFIIIIFLAGKKQGQHSKQGKHPFHTCGITKNVLKPRHHTCITLGSNLFKLLLHIIIDFKSIYKFVNGFFINGIITPGQFF